MLSILSGDAFAARIKHSKRYASIGAPANAAP